MKLQDYKALIDLPTINWKAGGRIRLLDQTLLPGKIKYIELKTLDEVCDAIVTMKVRGAPAIGVTAAMGMALAARRFNGEDRELFQKRLAEAAVRLAATRPTAVNLFWAIERMRRLAEKNGGRPVGEIADLLEAEATAVHEEDIAMNVSMAKHGAKLFPRGANALTHCNAGSLATGGFGTALGVIREAHRQGRIGRVFVDETRPRLQGAKLTALELHRANIPLTLICDNMAGSMMARGLVDAVIVGADRIAANGDAANKIGTYSVATLAKAHKIPFYVAAPVSTIDFSLKSGAKIPIENRNVDEVSTINGERLCPKGIEIANPAFDVTPNRLITAIITEKGVFRASFRASFEALYLKGKGKKR